MGLEGEQQNASPRVIDEFNIEQGTGNFEGRTPERKLGVFETTISSLN
jgi:hypothetical protein